VPDSPDASDQDAELRAHVQRALAATYEVDQEIGRGGMGIVYRAKDKRLKRYVAIKLLPPELSFRRDIRSRFLREAETAAQLSHPNIVPIYAVDEVENLVFFVMACVDGDNLATRLKNRGPLPIDQVRRVMTEVADALAYAHQRGVIHRDIKPDNILMDGVDGRALVTDFGIARAASGDGDSARLTATGIAIGTPAYMSPEQASGDRDVDGRSDLYSLGIVAYQMLVGEPPFIGSTTPVLLVKHLTEVPVPVNQRRADVPSDLTYIVMRLLQKAPEQRFANATELVQALKSGAVPQAPMGTLPTNARTDANSWSPPNGSGLMSSAFGSANSGNGQLAQGMNPFAAGQMQSRGGDESGEYQPSALDWERWNDPRVVKFRKSMRYFLAANVILATMSVFADKDLLSITSLWSIFIAFKYAKLWSNDRDWRDVLYQPRHRMFGEVVSHIADSVMATFSRKHRDELRQKDRLRNTMGISLSQKPTPPMVLASSSGGNQGGYGGGAYQRTPYAAENMSDFGEYASIVNRARVDRDEIVRLVATLPPPERARVPEVANTAAALVSKIEAIAGAMATTARVTGARSAAEIDAEVSTLEAEANPFDTARSEARVRRLAQLRRERRMVNENTRQRGEQSARLESCRLALENVRLDLVRLRTGNSSVQSVTLVAEQAMALAREVDLAVAAASEVRELTKARSPK
jgi:serine/threonine protein kinase